MPEDLQHQLRFQFDQLKLSEFQGSTDVQKTVIKLSKSYKSLNQLAPRGIQVSLRLYSFFVFFL